MKYLLVLFLGISLTHADTYTIKWQENNQVEDYSLDVLCLDTGFSTMKRYSKTTTSVDIELAQNQTYKIILYASSKTSSLTPSNTLIIKTSKPKPTPNLKAPKITAIKKDD